MTGKGPFMKKIWPLALCCCFLFCSKSVVKMDAPEKFEGLTQLVLASQTQNISFTETLKKRAFVVFASKAVVQVESNVTFDFYMDFEKDGYKIKLSDDKKVLHITAPPIRVKKPVINQSTVSYPQRGILVNEEKEAVAILEDLTERFIEEGEKLLEEERVRAKCNEKLSEYLLGLGKEMGYNKVETIDIEYKSDVKQPEGPKPQA